MLLAIDVGNTNSLFALIEDGNVVQSWRISTDQQRTADEYMVWLSQLMGLAGLARGCVCAIIIATVVPQALFNIQRLCRKYFEIEPRVVGAPDLDLGITINLPNPREVGADRLVNAVAAHHYYPGDSIIVDFGTATTFDVVDAQGVYQGGIITPGINLSIDALFMAAAKLPRISIEPPAEGLGVIGKSTIHAMQSGIFWGYVGMIEGLTARIRAQLARPCQVIGTGGLGVLFHKHTSTLDVMDVDLTIKGLALIHARQPQFLADTKAGNQTGRLSVLS
jgi:type III pantothenate kinase